jgi:DnaK suppressor protein
MLVTERHAHNLSSDRLRLLRAALVAEAQAQAAQVAVHVAAANQLRDLMDPDSVLERELAEAGALRAQEAMVDVRDALERIDAGSYGLCESCGRPVPFERLETVPSARFCVSCPGRHTGWRMRGQRPS